MKKALQRFVGLFYAEALKFVSYVQADLGWRRKRLTGGGWRFANLTIGLNLKFIRFLVI